VTTSAIVSSTSRGLDDSVSKELLDDDPVLVDDPALTKVPPMSCRWRTFDHQSMLRARSADPMIPPRFPT
jgi:hypothetical protein